jgi:hypothetical protein
MPALHITGLYALRLLRGLGFRKAAVGLRPLCGFAPAHFFVSVKMLRIFPYRAQKNVAYNRERYMQYARIIVFYCFSLEIFEI